jgi:cytochrome bd ubiquinol oxidase subunit I
MSPLTAARVQMELSLGFHMIFASVGMALPVMLLIVERRWMRTGDHEALALAKTWAKGTAVLFAIGAVSGTALSFELGLLWPRFMEVAGPLIGPAFALEGYAFFIEAIFLGLYLYGWDRLTPAAHWWCGVAVAASGVASGVLVLSANAWMQDPVGFHPGGPGTPPSIDPLAALFNPAWRVMAIHSTFATYQAVGFAVAGLYAWALLRGGGRRAARYYALGLKTAMILATVAAVLQPLSGDALAKRAYHRQPAKLAAMEGHFTTGRCAPLRIGGLPDPDARVTRYSIDIPCGLSFLSTGDPNAEILGLEHFPRDQWPNVIVTHLAFQIMVGAGSLMLGVAGWYVFERVRARRAPDAPLSRALLTALAACAPLGFIALEAGWVVTEAGRQPWVIYGILRTADAVTPVSGVTGSLAIFTVLYLTLAIIVLVFLRRLARGEGVQTR